MITFFPYIETVEHIDTARIACVVTCSSEAVDEYKNRMLRGESIPPIIVYEHRDGFRIHAGNHRAKAAQELGKTVLAVVRRDPIPKFKYNTTRGTT